MSLTKDLKDWDVEERKAWKRVSGALTKYRYEGAVNEVVEAIHEWGLTLVSREEARSRLGQYGP